MLALVLYLVSLSNSQSTLCNFFFQTFGTTNPLSFYNAFGCSVPKTDLQICTAAITMGWCPYNYGSTPVVCPTCTGSSVTSMWLFGAYNWGNGGTLVAT